MGQPNSQPFEIIGAPLTLYVAPVGTAFPLVSAAPGGSWTKIGTSGARNYTEEGVTVSNPQALTKFRSAGSAGVRKAFRTEDDFMVKVVLADMSPEMVANGMNSNVITTVGPSSGVPGTKKLGLSRGLKVATMALLARGASPEGDDMVAQYEVPLCYQSGSPSPVFTKGQAAGWELEWTAIEDPNATSDDELYGRLVIQTDPPA
jgi:hypothetical protein